MAEAAVAHFIWGEHSRHYHASWNLTERCNTDQLAGRRTGGDAPEGKKPCKYCVVAYE